ncbi:MAG TPA: diguanylate cyclase [Solirubrobacteraceae bacterium]|nr:diguanylate cyclase [Solirubrobacteraceae bacterium]
MKRDHGPGALPTALVLAPSFIAVAAMAAGEAIPRSAGACWDVAWTASAFAAFVGMLLARRTAAPGDRCRWTLWAAAAASWLIGQVLWNVYGVTGFPQSPSLADVGWWGFAGIIIFSLVRSRASSRSVRMAALFETLPLIGGAIALSMAGLWHEATVSTLPLAAKVSALVYPAIYITAAVLMFQAMIAGALPGSRSPALRLVLGGMAAQALAFGLWSRLLLQQTYIPGQTPLDPVWVAGLIMIAVGGLLAARRPESAAPRNEPARQGGILPAILFALLIAALLEANLTHAPLGARFMLRVSLLLSGVALLVRSTLLERRLRELLHRERAALAALGERETELARLNAQLVEDSRRDPLTGMRNRRALSDDLLRLEAERREQGAGSYALALCDVDHFKAYNDRLGHLAGDQALREIAATVRGALRRGDVAYRFGGEELLLLLRNVTGEEAVAAAERVRAAVQRAAMPHPAGVAGVMTVSIGVAAGDADPSALMARADAALYDAKRSGRNRALAAGEGAGLTGPVRHHDAADEPVPRHVRSMLAVSRAAACGQGPMPVLEALAETIRSELAFHIVSINLLDADRGELTCVVVLGDDDARRTLLGRVGPWREWENVLGSEHERGGAIWIPAGAHAWEDESLFWTPPAAAAPGPDSWDPDDMLVLPLRGQNGSILGIVSVDQPVNGRRPDDSQIAYLMAVADHAALAVEQTRRDSVQAAAAQEQSAELRLAAVMLLAETLDLRDASTARHSRTVGAYAQATALALGLPGYRVEQIRAAGILHDLGKLGIADAILHKPGPLDEAEWREMRQHPEIGARILEHAGLHETAGWVRAHHERVDGQGYPDRLAAERIPLEARILAVADAYEAMIADRPYRAGMPPEAAQAELERCSGSQFDADVVAAFLSTLEGVGGVAGLLAAEPYLAPAPA